jgi:hypothetical protein
MAQGPLQATVAISPTAGGNKQAPLQMDATGNLLIGQGSTSALNKVAGASVIKAGPGRVCKVIVNTAGTGPGQVNDCLTTGAVAASNLVAVIPNTVGVYAIDFPFAVGIVLTVGTGQVVSISFD